jgi:hypothetical protein
MPSDDSRKQHFKSEEQIVGVHRGGQSIFLWWRYDEMVPSEPSHFPVVPHRSTGVNCIGCIVPEPDGEQVTLKCNQCGTVVGTINAAILKALTQAISDGILVHKFDELDAPEVLTSISEECQRMECERCPGIFQREEAGDQPVFCVHSCHKVAERGVSSINWLWRPDLHSIFQLDIGINETRSFRIHRPHHETGIDPISDRYLERHHLGMIRDESELALFEEHLLGVQQNVPNEPCAKSHQLCNERYHGHRSNHQDIGHYF